MATAATEDAFYARQNSPANEVGASFFATDRDPASALGSTLLPGGVPRLSVPR